MDDGLDCDHVVLNNYESINTLTNLLFDMGHRNIGLLLGPQDIYTSKERLSAYIDAHKDRGLQVTDDYVMYSNYAKSEGKQNCDYLFQHHPEVTVIITAGYRITLGALASITRKSLSVPEDISIVGFDIADIADILPNHLLVFSLPVKDIAVAVGDIIIKRMNSDMSGFPLKTVIKTEFIQGSSARWI